MTCAKGHLPFWSRTMSMVSRLASCVRDRQTETAAVHATLQKMVWQPLKAPF